MDAIENLKTRRSIRKFQNKEIDDDVLNEILDCARHALSSHNSQSWEFVVVTDVGIKEKLSEAHQWSDFVKTAPVVVVVCINNKLASFRPSEIATSAVAAENLMLAAHAKGLGSCWVYIKDNEDTRVSKYVKDLLKIPEHSDPLCMIPIGYPDQKPGVKKLRDLETIVHRNGFQI